MTTRTLASGLCALGFLALSACGGGGDSSPEHRLPLPAAGWTQVIGAAPWGTRDAGATVVHRGEIWMLGGWSYINDTSYVYNDAWASTDGANWRHVQPPWTFGMYPMAASFRGQMLYMGGLKNSRQADESLTNEIWTSSDGQDWTLRVPAAQWEPRIGGTLVEHQNRLWILDGKVRNSGDPSVFRNDVWRSDDGLQWTRVLDEAPWPARAFHCALSHEGRIWLIGGGDWDSLIARSDVWSSADGVTWTRHADAPWEGRIWHACFSYADRLFVFGGRLFDPIRTVDEIWSTNDGHQWTRSTDTMRPGPRHAAYVAKFENRVWVMGGSAAGFLQPDVWQFYLP